MAVASLRYDAASGVEETKGGIFVYDGTASRFHEWEFRTRLRWTSTKKEDQPKAMNDIVAGLRGEAVLAAMEIGLEELLKEDALDKLMEVMRGIVFPQARAEAKELYKVGHKMKGPLSRQAQEPMVSYISRRRRWTSPTSSTGALTREVRSVRA